MKKLLSLCAAVLFAVGAVSAQTIQLETVDMDYGTIEKGADGVREFKFKNTGTAPLVIENAVGSCGCTVPSYPKETIMPGQSNSIKVKYDTNRVGPFTKYVTLTTNDPNNKEVRLKIFGDVKDQPAAIPPQEKSMFN